MRLLMLGMLSATVVYAEPGPSPFRPERAMAPMRPVPMTEVPMSSMLTDEDIVTELYQLLRARKPSAIEKVAAKSFLSSYGMDRKSATRDLVWALTINQFGDRQH